jgi:tetraacyldisaccharide 4'-kinase
VRRFKELAGQRGLAFAGIADPAGFFDELEREGAVLAATLAFPDHSLYGDEECTALARLRKSSRADYLITTAKDAVKLKGLGGDDVPCYVASLELEIRDAAPLCQLLDKLLQNGR